MIYYPKRVLALVLLAVIAPLSAVQARMAPPKPPIVHPTKPPIHVYPRPVPRPRWIPRGYHVPPRYYHSVPRPYYPHTPRPRVKPAPRYYH